MEVPEFDLFARIENLERVVAEAYPVATDASNCAPYVSDLSFIAGAIYHPDIAKSNRDSALQKLRELDFNDPWLDLLAADLLEICETLEKRLSAPVA